MSRFYYRLLDRVFGGYPASNREHMYPLFGAQLYEKETAR